VGTQHVRFVSAFVVSALTTLALSNLVLEISFVLLSLLTLYVQTIIFIIFILILSVHFTYNIGLRLFWNFGYTWFLNFTVADLSSHHHPRRHRVSLLVTPLAVFVYDAITRCTMYLWNKGTQLDQCIMDPWTQVNYVTKHTTNKSQNYETFSTTLAVTSSLIYISVSDVPISFKWNTIRKHSRT